MSRRWTSRAGQVVGVVMRWPDSAAIMGNQGSFMAARVGAVPRGDFAQKGGRPRNIVNLEDGRNQAFANVPLAARERRSESMLQAPPPATARKRKMKQ